jgi:hypothetical protein
MCLALVNEIASDQKKCQCVLWYADFKSIVTVQHNFQRAYEQKHILANHLPGISLSLQKWVVLRAEITGKVTNIRKDCDKHKKVLFKESDISINRCSLDLDVPKTMV